MSFPALLDAGKDPRFTQKGSLAVVYMRLIGILDFGEFRRVWAGRLAKDLRLKPHTVGAALRTLADSGYIERGTKVLDVYTYRLRHSRPSDHSDTSE